jgi:hypothetical protein
VAEQSDATGIGVDDANRSRRDRTLPANDIVETTPKRRMSLESLRDSKIVDAINSGGVAFAQPPANRSTASGIRGNGHSVNTSTTGKNPSRRCPIGLIANFYASYSWASVLGFTRSPLRGFIFHWFERIRVPCLHGEKFFTLFL